MNPYKKIVHRQQKVDLPRKPSDVSEDDTGKNTLLLEEDAQSLHGLPTAMKVTD